MAKLAADGPLRLEKTSTIWTGVQFSTPAARPSPAQANVSHGTFTAGSGMTKRLKLRLQRHPAYIPAGWPRERNVGLQSQNLPAKKAWYE